MKRFAALGLVIVFLLSILVLTSPSAKADEGCVVNIVGVKVCGELLGQPLPPVATVTVVPPPITIPGPTVTVPGPTSTATVYRPGDSRTIYRQQFVPGSTRTVYGPVRTKTLPPATETVTTTPQTVVETVTRQPQPERATIGPTETKRKYFLDLPPVTTPAAVGIGIGTIILLVSLILLSMMGGYYLGYKDSDRENANFMNALRDKIAYRGKHS